MFRRATFALDPLPGRYEGWTRRGARRGRVVRPRFEAEVVRRLLLDLAAAGRAGGFLDEATGEVVVYDAGRPEEPESFRPELARAGGREVRVWAIGAPAWAWTEAVDTSE